MSRDLRERIEALPGMDRLLPAAEGLPPLHLVGGAVRDLLLGERNLDLDVAVEGDALEAARALAERLGGTAVEHDRFGTATVRAGELSLDLATTRRETYPEPGALPEVEPAALAEDLARRDFTVNAMAAGLSGDDLGVLHDPHGGRRDLEDGTIRVLHDRSFEDDPTRLLRAVRYEARLGMRMDPATEALARSAADAAAPATVSGPRVADELLDLLAEAEMPGALERLSDLGIAAALHVALRPDPELAAAAALGSAETGADRVLAALAALVARSPAELVPWLDHLQIPRPQAGAVARAATRGPELARLLRTGMRASEIHSLLAGEPAEALALALAHGAPAEPVLRHVGELRHVRLEITGDDLVAAGVPESPVIGEALAETLRRRLDGEVSGREEELRMALRVAGRGEG